MKKVFALTMALAMMLTLFAGCGKSEPAETVPAQQLPASALEILETVWGQFGDDEKFFAMGGDFDNLVDGAPGKASNTDFLTGNLIVPADQTANITDAASLLHSMNANTFTGAAYAVADVQAFANAMQTAIQGNHWMCGFPEKLVIAEVGGYAVVMFGHGDAVNPFQTKLVDAYPTTQILVDEAIAA